ncbi:sulfurtransferase complex subunit TusD [Aliidiomarina soli]|uniref:Sulfurtransferase complex subunit TusD n=1 Tax=Aliidiomarina soli TaxID=1928574 RepID=A0A432WHN4_9GAMM|nr:sulfurtransferase complex subunit TusD [Aliidiomarina soli]RUO33310.1 sulfurtransferase complex subunit TusD [Aliidiomarina soli]
MASITCLIQHSPEQGHHSYSAYKFCQAAVAKGHQIKQVFFYGDAVHHGNALAHQSADEQDVRQLWQSLASNHQFPLVICATVAARHGIVAAGDLKDFSDGNLAPGYHAGGLAEYMEAVATSDRLVQF